MSDELREALRRVQAAVERAGPPVLYLHDPDTGIPFGVLILEPTTERRTLLDAVEITLAQNGWDPHDHSHLEGDEDDEQP